MSMGVPSIQEKYLNKLRGLDSEYPEPCKIHRIKEKKSIPSICYPRFP
jgi:hypothetical protein